MIMAKKSKRRSELDRSERNGIELTTVIEGKKKKKSKELEDTAGNHLAGGKVAEDVRSKVGYAVEAQPTGLKKRKRNEDVEGGGENQQDIIAPKKKDTSHGDKEFEHDGPDTTKEQLVFHGRVDISELESAAFKEERGKRSRREREVESEGYAHGSDLEAETVVLPSKIRKKKGKENRKGGEAEVPCYQADLDAQSGLQDGVDDCDVESLPLKKKKEKRKMIRGNRETEFVGLKNESVGGSDGGNDRAVGQDLVDEDDEESLPTKKERKKSRRNREVADEVLRDRRYLDVRIREQAVAQDTVEIFDVQSLRTKKKKGRKSRGDGEVDVEDFRYNIRSDGDKMTDQAVVGKNDKERENVNDKERGGDGTSRSSSQFSVCPPTGSNTHGSAKKLEASPTRSKKGKTSRQDRETEHEGHLVTTGSDRDRGQDQQEAHVEVVKSHMGSFPLKKIKKTVRFQEPEIHWREEEEHEEHGEVVDDMGTEGHELGDEYNSSGVHCGDVFSHAISTVGRGWSADMGRTDLTYGFFSKEEDEKLKTAIYDFIKAKKWGEDEGLEMLLNSKAYSETRGAWVEIATCLPHRPVKQINSRAHRLLGGLKRGAWSQEELEKLKELHEVHGRDWKAVEKVMGRPAQLCKDKWRVLRLAPIMRTGRWSEEELDRLCKYVRWSLKLKERYGKRKKDCRMLRDDINWEIIGEKMGRSSGGCAGTWYERLASSLISQGNWANGDDRRLLRSLMESGASSEEAVDWDKLLDDRDGLTCERRWYQMKRLLSEVRAPFEDKLEQLVKRYAPDLIGIEEDFGISVPVVE